MRCIFDPGGVAAGVLHAKVNVSLLYHDLRCSLMDQLFSSLAQLSPDTIDRLII
jgi:hypothetical protein